MITLCITVIALTACGGKEKVNKKSLDELGFNPSGLPIVEQEVTFKIVSPKNALADNYEDMKIFKEMYNDTNVKINWENLSEESFSARRNLMLADTKNLPDAMYHAGFSDKDIIQYSTAKTIIPIDKYLDYMPNFKKILESRPDIKQIITSPDGHIYSLPRVEEMGLLQYPNLLFLNKTWVEKLVADGKLNFTPDYENGITIEQFATILKAFKDNDMNGNGDKNDEIPLSFMYQGWQGNQSDLYAAFGIPENIDHRTIVDNKVVFTATMDKFKTATNFYAKWVTDGLIDKEVFTQGQLEFLAKGKGSSQKLGAFYWWEKETVIKQEWYDDYIVLPPLIGLNGEQMIGVSNNQEISKGNFVVFSKCLYPEVLLRWIDRFYEPQISAQINYGPIGIVYEEELNEEGMLVNKPLPNGVTADELRLKNAPLGVIYLSYEQWENTVVMEPRAKLRLQLLSQYAKPYVPANVTHYPNVSFTMSEINTLNRNASDVYDYVWQQQTKWLLEGGVTDAEWNAYKSQLNKMGFEELMKAYQSAYDRYSNK